MKESISQHGNVLIVGDCGILILGPPRSGKSSLTLGLIERAKSHELDASFVCDDRVIITNEEGKLIAKTPHTIAGKMEIRGYGIIDLPFREEVYISLVVQFRVDDEIVRMPESSSIQIQNVNLPLLEVPMRHEEAAARIVFAWLKENMNFKIDFLQRTQKPFSGNNALNK